MKTKSFQLSLTIVMSVLCCLFLATQVSAQATKKTAEERAKELTDKMKTELTLNDTQYQSAYQINLKYAQKVDELAASTADKKSKEANLKSLAESKDKELKGVFTDAQYKTYEKKKEELKDELKKEMKADMKK